MPSWPNASVPATDSPTIARERSRKPKPGKFLEEPVKSFVERMARERPAGWLDAAGACLDLSVPELAFVCGSARRVRREANRTRAAVVWELGRVRLVGLPSGALVAEVIGETEQDESDARSTFTCKAQSL